MMNSFPWFLPGPQSKQVTATGSAPNADGTIVILSYTVPEGVIFSLRGVAAGADDPNSLWVIGSGQLLFTLRVTAGGGTRPVEFFVDLNNPIGGHIQPYPVLGRCEFEENNLLEWICVSDGTATDANLFAAIVGFERPAIDCSTDPLGNAAGR